MSKQSGFTLVELIVVIIILGILSATALPKFIDMSGDASTSAVKGVAGNLSTWGQMNKAAVELGRATGSNGVYAITDATDACAGAANSVLAGVTAAASTGAPVLTGITLQTTASTANETFQITGGTPKICAVDVVIKCILTHKNGQQATAFIPCTN